MNVIRLFVFTLSWFAVVFALSGALSFLYLRVSAAIATPVQKTIFFKSIAAGLEWTVSLAFYVSLLLSMNYALQKRVNPLASLILVCSLVCTLSFAASLGINRFRLADAPPFATENASLGEAGLMLSQGELTIALLDHPSVRGAPRVVSLPERPLFYQAQPVDERGEILRLPPAPFIKAPNRLFYNFHVDFSLSAREFLARAETGPVPFALQAAPLALLLVALSLVFDLGVWPLANLFIAAVFFRLVLALDVFVNSSAVRLFVRGFLKPSVPDSAIHPVIFAILTFLFLTCALAASFARRKNAKK
ncbi:MAG: hypothetical protein LBS82_06460 [Spirochaetaceae bacterium]|jgi:hypothetical protein|nr:hypothetical protein [Spirochaetaceae bacterium]